MKNLKRIKDVLTSKGSISEFEAMFRYRVGRKELSNIIDLIEREGFIMSKQRFFYDFEYDVLKINKNLK